MLEKLAERYMGDEVLLAALLHRVQNVFQAGSYLDTALHASVAKLEQQQYPFRCNLSEGFKVWRAIP